MKSFMNSMFGYICAALLVLGAAPASVGAETRPAMAMTVDAFVIAYNKSAQAMDMPTVLLKNLKKQSGELDNYQLPLTEFSMATMTTNANQRQLCGLIVNSMGDGSPTSGAVIMAAMLNTVMVFTPGMGEAERKDVLTKIGFFDGMMDGKMRKVTLKDCSIATMYNENLGVMLVVEK